MASVPIALGKLSIDSRPHRVCAVAYLMRGIAYDGKKDDDRAIADFNEALKINPNFAEAHNNRGSAVQAKGITTAPLPTTVKLSGSIRITR